MIKLMTTEKAVRMIELDNVLTISADKRMSKPEIKKEFEELFGVKIEGINTFIRLNKKYAYVKLNAKNPAIDIATKVGMI
ncbi:50S ribosomal protein L23 [archaeon]|jgi:ribosomal protein L23|nr:50S ribosomal protein L23 [archaeon]